MQITAFIKRGWRVREIIPLKLFLDHFRHFLLKVFTGWSRSSQSCDMTTSFPGLFPPTFKGKALGTRLVTWISVTWTAQAALHALLLSTKTSFNGAWIHICKYLVWGYRGNNTSIHDKYKFTSVLSRMLLSDWLRMRYLLTTSKFIEIMRLFASVFYAW